MEELRYEFELEIYAAIVHFMIFYDLCVLSHDVNVNSE